MKTLLTDKLINGLLNKWKKLLRKAEHSQIHKNL